MGNRRSFPVIYSWFIEIERTVVSIHWLYVYTRSKLPLWNSCWNCAWFQHDSRLHTIANRSSLIRQVPRYSLTRYWRSDLACYRWEYLLSSRSFDYRAVWITFATIANRKLRGRRGRKLRRSRKRNVEKGTGCQRFKNSMEQAILPAIAQSLWNNKSGVQNVEERNTFRSQRMAGAISRCTRDTGQPARPDRGGDRVKLSPPGGSWHRKAGVKPEYEAFSPVSAGNSAVRRPRMC